MKSVLLALAALNVMTVLGGAIPQKRATCGLHIEEANSEGGGGPGQSNENIFTGSTRITDSNGNVLYSDDTSWNGNTQHTITFTNVEGNSEPVRITGGYFSGDLSFETCSINWTGAEVSTTPQLRTESGTVSVTIASCDWNFDC
ncbi:hypothetical protein GGI42DRAFT_349206 [Trichoderma sp. SZMC 28013]